MTSEDRDDLTKLFEILNKIPFLTPQDGDYCELEDENQPDGIVVFRRKSGAPFMYMPRADYEALIAGEDPYKEES